MDVGARAGVLRSFATLPDPRMKRTRKHELLDLIVIAICGVICGADGWAQLAEFGLNRGAVTLLQRAIAAEGFTLAHHTVIDIAGA